MTKEEFEESLKVEGETLLQALQELEEEGFIEKALARHGLVPRKPSSLEEVKRKSGVPPTEQ